MRLGELPRPMANVKPDQDKGSEFCLVLLRIKQQASKVTGNRHDAGIRPDVGDTSLGPLTTATHLILPCCRGHLWGNHEHLADPWIKLHRKPWAFRKPDEAVAV